MACDITSFIHIFKYALGCLGVVKGHLLKRTTRTVFISTPEPLNGAVTGHRAATDAPQAEVATLQACCQLLWIFTTIFELC